MRVSPILEDMYLKYKRKNQILFSRDSLYLQELLARFRTQKHRTLVLWSLDCARESADCIEAALPGETRPGTALALCQEWAEGTVKMPVAKKALLAVHAIAKEIDDPALIARCHAVGQACGSVHVETHAIGLAFYELTALVREHGIEDCEDAIFDRIQQYHDRLTYWEQNVDAGERSWADFLLDDSAPNKELLLYQKHHKD